jgi:hypothetical protein
VSDVNGECHFCVDTDRPAEAVEAPPGYTYLGAPQTKQAEWDGEKGVVSFAMNLIPVRNIDLYIRLPDGASPLRVLIATGCAGAFQQHVFGTTADAPGHRLLRDFPIREGSVIYVRQYSQRDGAFAAALRMVAGPPPPLAAKFVMTKDWTPGPVELVLKPAVVGEVELRDEAGNQGFGAVNLKVNGANLFFLEFTQRVGGRSVARIPGMLPDTDYEVNLVGAQIIAKQVFRVSRDEFLPRDPWRFGPGEEHPRLVLTYTPPPPPKPRSQDDLAKECRALGATAERHDPVQNELTWYVLKSGVAAANGKTLEMREFRELLGETDFVVSAIAFGKDRVWLGTNKGLFAWDRRDMFWTRFAVGGKFLDLPVKELLLDEAGKLRVTVEQNGQPRTFEYAATVMAWKEVP